MILLCIIDKYRIIRLYNMIEFIVAGVSCILYLMVITIFVLFRAILDTPQNCLHED